MTKWRVSDMPSGTGRSAVVTGTGGLGFEDALALARAGWNVTIAGRNPSKGADAVARIQQASPDAKVRFEQLDLANIASIHAFGAKLCQEHQGLDLLINNAAVMAPPKRQSTADGFELQFGTNHLGHFALTGVLLPLLRRTRSARVVTVSSIAARSGVMNLDDLQSHHTYRPMAVYSQSKLANLLFSFELQRRSIAFGWGISSIAAHPGISRTDLIPNGAGWFSVFGMMRLLLGRMLFQSPAQGALPTLFAATSPSAEGGTYYGPDRMNETRGYPTAAKVPLPAMDSEISERLWVASERLTGVSFYADARPV